MKEISPRRIAAFRRKIWRFYSRHRRQLPFRETADPYKIVVAEFMLQQTQVERVIPKYKAWLKQWPTWAALAGAGRRELLKAWSGLGYNRRAVYLGRLASIIVDRFDGQLPDNPDILQTLPGFGPYTAHAVLIFAFNRPFITIDTNIRRVLSHEFNLPRGVSKADLEDLARRLLPRGRSRDWHNALMDYSRAVLPVRLPAAPPTGKRPPFQGSRRQIRGEIIRRLTASGRVAIDRIAGEKQWAIEKVADAAESLRKEGLVRIGKRFITLR
jgi:A/G-specific adenine glycosylase